MFAIDAVLIVQAVLGAVDNLWHHEWRIALPRQRGAHRELALHAAREALYGALFFGLAWWSWHGALAGAVVLVLVLEAAITLADFLEEDRTRVLPPFERALHMVLTASYGFFVGLLAPRLWAWAQQSTGLVGADRGVVSWLLTIFAIAVLTWSVRNTIAAHRLGREPKPQLAAVPLWSDAVLVTGGTGFVGRALVARLRREGRRVLVLSRDARQARHQFDSGVEVFERLGEIPAETRIAAIVHLAGARVLGRPWTHARRRTLMESRTRVAAELRVLVRRLEQRPTVLVAASAVGFYGVPPAGVLCDESSPPMPGVFQSDLCAAAEHEAKLAETLGVRVVQMRLGVVLGRAGGAYPPQALAARLGVAARLGTGRQAVPWIHLDDAVGLLCWAVEDSTVRGPINAVAPEHCDQAGFVKALAASHGRRVRLTMPAPLLRALGGEMTTLLLDGQAVVPQHALAAGYPYAFPSLAGALQDLARPTRGPDSPPLSTGSAGEQRSRQ